MNTALPTRTFIERVVIPVRRNEEAESGLDSFVGSLAPAVFMGVGLHALGEMLHALQSNAEIQDSMRLKPMGQSEVMARQAYDQNLGQPGLSTAEPMIMVTMDRVVERPMDLLDPSLQTTDPVLAGRYQRSFMADTLGEAFRRVLRNDEVTPDKPKVAPASPMSSPSVAEGLRPWRVRR